MKVELRKALPLSNSNLNNTKCHTFFADELPRTLAFKTFVTKTFSEQQFVVENGRGIPIGKTQNGPSKTSGSPTPFRPPKKKRNDQRGGPLPSAQYMTAPPLPLRGGAEGSGGQRAADGMCFRTSPASLEILSP